MRQVATRILNFPISGCTTLIQSTHLFHYYRANAHAALSNWDKAIADYDAAIRLRPNFGEAFYGRGLAYFSLGRYEVAIRNFNAAMRLGLRNADVLNSLCWTRAVATTDLILALDECNESLKLMPSASTYDSRGFVYFRLRRYPEAIADYNQALALDATLSSSLYMRGKSRLRLGDAQGYSDIEAARNRNSEIGAQYARYGVTP